MHQNAPFQRTLALEPNHISGYGPDVFLFLTTAKNAKMFEYGQLIHYYYYYYYYYNYRTVTV